MRQTCSHCGISITEMETWRTSDGSAWCPKHGDIAVRMERLALVNGDGSFHYPPPTPRRDETRESVLKNNKRRFGPLSGK